ncbi:MAG: tetratricopeptide repeat protein, partial [Nitrososphaeria archaeon]
MARNSKQEILSYLENVSLFILGITFLAFPLLFTTLTTDAFILPKQILLAAAAAISIVTLGVRMIIEGKVRLRTSPFDLPVFLFLITLLLSALFAVNKYDALISFVPMFFVILLYFVIQNLVQNEKSILFIVSSLVLGTAASTILSVLAFFKIYLLPFDYTHVQTFSTLGSLLDQAIFTALILPLAGYIAWPMISPLFNKKASEIFGDPTQRKNTVTPLTIVFSIASAILLIGLGVTVYQLITSAKPLILPLTTGFQTAFAAISQDTGRVLQGFLFGSGYGTYFTDFTRFKQAAYNTNSNLWSLTFFRSSSFVLEILATTGVLGLGSFLFIIYRFIKERSFFLPMVLAIAAAFLLPFSFNLQALFFILLAIFVALRALHAPSRYADLEFYFVALKHGLILAQPEGEKAPHDRVNTRYGKILPFAFVFIMLALVGYVGFFSVQYAIANVTFQRSYDAIRKNDARAALTAQAQAIQRFPYEDFYHVEFSRLNLRIANAIAANQPQGASPSAEVQQDIINSIQRAITAGRSAVTISPQTALNWNNLSDIYRSLIGFGQNAEQFAILTAQQAITLDPSNPQQYINLGGIYYQLQSWDEAQRQFQLAVNLKPDYANAYYNLGHALENKGDLQNALQAYQIVQQLVVNDKENSERIKNEIQALQNKIKSGQTAQQQASNQSEQQNQQGDLKVNQPSTKLPEQKEKAEISAPPKTLITPTPSQNPSP